MTDTNSAFSGATAIGYCSSEPYPVPQHVFDKLVDKFVGGEALTEREKTLWDYLTQVNETALMERKLALVETTDYLDVSDEQLAALGMALTIDGSVGSDDPYAWKDHDGGECPVSKDAMVFVRLRDGTESRQPDKAVWWEPWDWESDTSSDYNIVAYRIALPEEIV